MGYLYALTTAVLIALSDVLVRKLFRRVEGLGVREMALMRVMLVAPLLLLALPLAGPIPREPTFWLVVALGMPLELIALLLYVRALRDGEVSVALPLLSLTPMFVMLSGPLIAGDPWPRLEALGVIAIVLGVWHLQIPHAKPQAQAQHGARVRGRLRRRLYEFSLPLRAIGSQPAARGMLIVVVCYSLTGGLGKLGVVVAGPLAMFVWYFLALALAAFVLVIPRIRNLAAVFRQEPWLCGALALTYGVHLLAHVVGLSFIPAVELVAIKRLSIIFAALMAVWILREALPAGRVLGILLMLAGALWISMFGQ